MLELRLLLLQCKFPLAAEVAELTDTPALGRLHMTILSQIENSRELVVAGTGVGEDPVCSGRRIASGGEEHVSFFK